MMITLPPINLLVLLYGLIWTSGIITSVAGLNGGSGLFMPVAVSGHKCMHEKVHHYLHAGCSKLNLKNLPSLNKDIEILEFSENKLREIDDNTLSKYTSLKAVFFTENFIKSISDNAFIYLKKLQVLDLTNNGLIDFPKNILGLPNLKKLFLSKNSLTDASLEPTAYAEDSELEYFDLSENHLNQLPQLGYLTQLKYLNLSNNEIKYVKVSNISIYCSLEVLDLKNNPIQFDDNCECQAFNLWISTQKIKIYPPFFTCDKRSRRNIKTFQCAATKNKDSKIFKEALKLSEKCTKIIETKKIRKIAMITGISIGGFIIFLIVIGFCIRKRKKNQLKKLEKQKKLTKEQKEINATDELLNGAVEQNN